LITHTFKNMQCDNFEDVHWSGCQQTIGI